MRRKGKGRRWWRRKKDTRSLHWPMPQPNAQTHTVHPGPHLPCPCLPHPLYPCFPPSSGGQWRWESPPSRTAAPPAEHCVEESKRDGYVVGVITLLVLVSIMNSIITIRSGVLSSTHPSSHPSIHSQFIPSPPSLLSSFLIASLLFSLRFSPLPFANLRFSSLLVSSHLLLPHHLPPHAPFRRSVQCLP